MTHTQSLRLPRLHAPRMRTTRGVELTVWAIFTAITPIAIGIGMLGSILRAEAGLGFGPTDVLFYLGLAAGLVAGVVALSLGARPWAAALVASPAFIVSFGSVFDEDWVLLALFASPFLVLVGVVGVMATADSAPRHPFTRWSARAPARTHRARPRSRPRRDDPCRR